MTLVVLEHLRWEVAAQRCGVEVGPGGDFFTPVDECLA
jgi:hypothetical protein